LLLISDIDCLCTQLGGPDGLLHPVYAAMDAGSKEQQAVRS
jgi:hypothetical protein